MTIGELAQLFNAEFGLGADLEVIPMEGWRRDMYFDATGLPWVMPSPNMPTLDTAIVYPGSVLFEGTNISEGRGTTRPFEIVGAPWAIVERFADSERLAHSFHKRVGNGILVSVMTNPLRQQARSPGSSASSPCLRARGYGSGRGRARDDA